MARLPRMGQQFVDDRGRPAIFRIGQVGGDADAQVWAEDPLVKDIVERNRFVAEISLAQQLSPRMLVLMLVQFAMMAMLLGVIPWIWPGVPIYLTFSGMIAVLWIGTVVFAGWRNMAPSRTLRLTLLNSGRCAACGYRLEGVPIAPDDKFECPECAAAWNSNDVHLGASALGGVMQIEQTGKISKYFGQRAVVPDGRDRMVWLVNIWSMGRNRSLAGIGDDRTIVFRNAMRDARSAGLGLRVFRLLLAVLFLVGVMRLGPGVLAMLGISAPLWAERIAQIALGLSVVSMSAPVIWRSFLGHGAESKEDVKAALLRRQWCPSCAQDLAQAAVESDACVVCPRCRAAWPSGRWRPGPSAGGTPSQTKSSDGLAAPCDTPASVLTPDRPS